MAARRISQETFDDVVKENIEEFDMDKEEARKEAIAQFRKQGIDLTNIDLTGGEGRQQLLDAIAVVQNTKLHTNDEQQLASLTQAITEIAAVCDKTHISSRRNLLILEEEGGLNALQWHLDASEHPAIVIKTLKVLADLSFQSDFTRDLFEPGGSAKLVSLMQTYVNDPTVVDNILSFTEEKLALLTQCLVLCKVVSRSENNKTSLVRAELGALLVDLLIRSTAPFFPTSSAKNIATASTTSSGSMSSGAVNAQSVLPTDTPLVWIQLWEKSCHVIRGLCTFDDLRAEMSSSGDNGKYFLKNTTLLPILMVFGNSYHDYPELSGAALGAIRSFVNTNDAVQVIAQLGVLELLVRCLRETCTASKATTTNTTTTAASAADNNNNNSNNSKKVVGKAAGKMPVSLVRAVASLVRNVAADDHRKEQFVGFGIIELLHALLVLEPYRQDAGIVEHVFGSFAQITLRAPGNASRWMSLGASEVIVFLLRKFADKEVLQRQACLSIRNIAGRCPELHSTLLDAGIEHVLREAGRLPGCVDEAYSALRDLNCEVQYVRVGSDGKIIPAFETFGSVGSGAAGGGSKLNFRPVFEATDEFLNQRIEEEGSAPFAAAPAAAGSSSSSTSQHNDHNHSHSHSHSHSHTDSLPLPIPPNTTAATATATATLEDHDHSHQHSHQHGGDDCGCH